MRHVSRLVAVLGAATLLVIGGGAYALGSASGGKITVCVSHKHGTLYKARRCARRDKKLSWNAQGVVGPQGPGATVLTYNAVGSSSPTRTKIGTMGPWTITGLCTQSSGSTGTEIDVTGPGYSADLMGVLGGSGGLAASGTVPGPVKNLPFGSITPVTGQSVTSAEAVLFPVGAKPLELFFTFLANGGTPPSGVAGNTCHASFVITPLATPASAAAAGLVRVPARASSRATHRKTLLGLG